MSFSILTVAAENQSLSIVITNGYQLIIIGLPTLKRKEKSAYKPSDLWTTEDDILYLKYCKNKRDRCFHALAIETSCRPHEILNLKIKDIVFKYSNEKQARFQKQ